jgi:Ca2+-transporting ATPase
VFLELIIDPASTLVFESEPAAANIMERPPRRPGQRLLDARTLFGSLALGSMVFAAVAASYLWGQANGLPPPQISALSFHALVFGNLGLIAINRTPFDGSRWVRTNPAFWTIAIGAVVLLLCATRLPLLAGWFHFAVPPAAPSVAAAILPLLLLALVESSRRLRMRMRANASRD